MCLLQYYLFDNGRGMAIDGEVTEDNGVLKFVKGGPVSHVPGRFL